MASRGRNHERVGGESNDRRVPRNARPFLFGPPEA